jgi:hypothetical protein
MSFLSTTGLASAARLSLLYPDTLAEKSRRFGGSNLLPVDFDDVAFVSLTT